MPVQRFWEECSWSAFFPFFSFDWRNYARLIHSAEIPVSLSNFTGLKPRPHEQNCVLYWKCDKWIAKGQIIYHINCQRIWEVGWLLLKALTGLSGPTANPQKNEQCSPAAGMQIFRSESNIKKATYLSRRESFLSSKDTYLSSRDIYAYLSGGKNIVEKWRLIFSCVRGLTLELTLFGRLVNTYLLVKTKK